MKTVRVIEVFTGREIWWEVQTRSLLVPFWRTVERWSTPRYALICAETLRTKKEAYKILNLAVRYGWVVILIATFLVTGWHTYTGYW